MPLVSGGARMQRKTGLGRAEDLIPGSERIDAWPSGRAQGNRIRVIYMRFMNYDTWCTPASAMGERIRIGFLPVARLRSELESSLVAYLLAPDHILVQCAP